ncbi:low temperature requirement protein A [Streptomyces palmae]|uniref:Low temperature requirement protein A n=1 Tax=Streptomyces palmae TaxID=1701085 RepID=A0A4Z0GZ08_9ACTN|nr:low temperature requirement protein A [Streptomyces palmae]TGB03390.1 low temperature requirement protein A [Streptomyces palmae]
MADEHTLGTGHARPATPLRRMTARDRTELHRAATPLELFFDLCFVVAVAQAGLQLVHKVAEGHPGLGVADYAMLFFAVWWAWMNFSWFASAYDVDDVPYRVVTLIQIAGVLILAAGVPRAAQRHDFTVVWLGYAVMRLALVSQWLRAAASTTGEERRCAFWYAGGVAACQVGWLGLVVLPEHARPWLFLVMAVLELSVPLRAERHYRTSWHPHHIAERYGLFTIIVLGETISAATVAVQSALDESAVLGELLPIACGGLLIVFAAWWIYFAVPIHEHLASHQEGFLWGYGHYLIFASAAGIGAGIEVAVEQATGKAHITASAAAAAVTVPSALFLFTVWLLHARHHKRGVGQLTLPVSAALVLLCTAAGRLAVLTAGLVCAASVAVGVALTTWQSRTAAA